MTNMTSSFSSSSSSSTGIGLTLSLCGALLNAVVLLFYRFPYVRKQAVNEFVYSTYVAVGAVLTSVVVLIPLQPFNLDWMGVPSGGSYFHPSLPSFFAGLICGSSAGLSYLAISGAGVAIGHTLWAAVNILTSHFIGIFFFHDQIDSLPLNVTGLFLLLFASVGLALLPILPITKSAAFLCKHSDKTTTSSNTNTSSTSSKTTTWIHILSAAGKEEPGIFGGNPPVGDEKKNMLEFTNTFNFYSNVKDDDKHETTTTHQMVLPSIPLPTRYSLPQFLDDGTGATAGHILRPPTTNPTRTSSSSSSDLIISSPPLEDLLPAPPTTESVSPHTTFQILSPSSAVVKPCQKQPTTHFPSSSSSLPVLNINRRRFYLGLFFSVLVGLIGGCFMMPMKNASENQQGFNMFFGFSLGALVATLIVLLITFPIFGSKRIRWKLKQTFFFAVAAGACWMAGFAFTLAAKHQLKSYCVAFDLCHLSLVFSTLWATCFFKEIKGKTNIALCILLSLLCFAAALLLAFSTSKHSPNDEKSKRF